MSKGKHVTFGSLGQHEIYLPTTGKGHKNHRDRRKCCHYNTESKYCSKIRNWCVGPTICRKYYEEEKTHKHFGQGHKKNQPAIGTTVYNTHGEEGKIVTVSGNICAVQFLTGKKVAAKYPDAFETGIFRLDKNSIDP